MKLFGNMVVGAALVVAGYFALASWIVGPSQWMIGSFHNFSLVLPLASFALMVVEGSTKGRQNWYIPGLALTAATLVFGMFVGASGLRMLFGMLSSDAVVTDTIRYRQMMASGIGEAISFFQRYLATSVFQGLLWSVLVRHYRSISQ